MPAAKLAPRMRAGRMPRAMLMRSVIGAGVYAGSGRKSKQRHSTFDLTPLPAVAHVDHLPHHVLGQPRQVLYPRQAIIEGVRLPSVLEPLGAPRQVRGVPPRDARLPLAPPRPAAPPPP